MILIGSRAVKMQDPSFPRGDKSDWDYVLDDDLTASLARGRGKDIHVSREVYWALHPYCHKTSDGLVPSLPALYTLKVSHAFWNIHWGKTMNDIVWFQERGIEFLPELHEKLYACWEARRGKKRALHLLITSMSKSWFPLFIVLHWKDLKNPDIDFVAKFEENIGNVRYISEPTAKQVR